MTIFRTGSCAAFLAALLLSGSATPSLAGPDGPAHWTEAFGASPMSYALSGPLTSVLQVAAEHPVVGTVRFTLVLTAGGDAVRVRFTNEARDTPMVIGAASVGLAAEQPGATFAAPRPLTFHGKAGIVIPPGAPVLSDPTPLETRSLDRLVVSAYLPQGVVFVPIGGAQMWRAPGDQTSAPALQDVKPLVGRPFVSGVAVSAPRALPVVVAFGDSLTDGARVKPVLHGYPEELARRFAAAPAPLRHAVVNAGIGGNRLLLNGWGDSGIARLDRDVFRVHGATHLILLEGINDIGMAAAPGSGPPVSAGDLIAGYRQVIARAHAEGVKVVGATLMPFQGAKYYTPAGEEVREAANRWIRTSGEFDGVIDFETAVRDPANPLRYRPDLDSGDHLHPNETGYRAMADAIDLDLFR